MGDKPRPLSGRLVEFEQRIKAIETRQKALLENFEEIKKIAGKNEEKEV